MWHLQSIHAKNLCSFLELEYSPKQGAATLIFGHNLDSDSQNSNGSGKSALIEAIAIALTGEPLRKVSADEIINDSQNEAVISAVLTNDSLGESMTINRRISRKQPQVVQIIKQTGPYDTDTEEVSQASVSDYNKYILDRLGITKEDIFANFILTARKYKSFLSSSDKEKKEIINRFSNGLLVDESIEKLHEDMLPVQKKLDEAEREVAACTGRVEALATEIEKAINESDERRASTAARIQNWQDLITEKRSDIRSSKKDIDDLNDYLDGLDMLDTEMQQLEKGSQEIDDVLCTVYEKFKNSNLTLTTDFAQEIDILNSRLNDAKTSVKQVYDEVRKVREALIDSEANYKETSQLLNTQKEDNAIRREKSEERLKKLTSTVQRIQGKIDELRKSQFAKNSTKASLENQLAGVIQCPNCKHEFVLNSDLDIAEARANLTSIVAELDSVANELESKSKDYDKVVSDGKNEREIESALERERRQIAADIVSSEETIEKAREECARYERKIDNANALLSELKIKQSNIRKQIFDEVFEIIDSTYKKSESQIKSLESNIEALHGTIQSYEKAIEAAQTVSEDDILASLKSSKEEHQKELEQALAKRNETESQLNKLTSQEATFVEFKTYLANTKINAISQITNEFLETIGSDIRVALSGYTILKSGKVRDKISVSLLRDGVDCGSFEKFSAGERVRVELASILSMNKLTNLNCEEGKGLDLLIADEVLDSADEQGLASVFKALNQTQLTSLVVSHGQVHEGYPNKITVVKSNGVSSIHGSTNND